MYKIFNENSIVEKFLNPANREDELKLSQFALLIDIDEGCLAWNSFTHCLCFFPDVNSYKIKTNFKELECFDDLLKNYFLVSEETDELNRLEQTRTLINNFDFDRQRFYFIFTTYACNARCPYCYESKIPISSMTEETAHDVADFLIKKYDGRTIHIRWFGGEPMVNSKVIDIICSELSKNNIDYKSSMISNAYLFDETKILHAVKEWHLNWIQITLDGPQDIYNKIKNYVGDNGNAFERVLTNIEVFTKHNVKVNVRFNVSSDNLQDFLELIDTLENRFKDNEYFYAYPKFLFDYYKPHSQEEMKKVIKSCKILFDRLENSNMLMPKSLSSIPVKSKCLADSDKSYSILPNGKFNKCHHEMPLVTVGDVKIGITNKELANTFKVKLPYSDKCKSCVLAPDCIQLKKCAHKCNEVHREYNIMWLESTLKMYYNKWKKNCE